MEIIKIPVAPIGANCYIVSEKRKAFIIDPGGDADKIIGAAKNFDVRGIMLTHCHFDHICALNDLAEAFPGIDIEVPELENEWLYNPKLNLSALFDDNFVFNGIPARLISDRSIECFLPGYTIHIIHTPGHTPGSTCFYINQSDDETADCENPVLFSGDTLFKSSIGRTDFPGGDSRKIIESIKNKLFRLPDHTVVYPGHNENTSIALEKKLNPFLNR